MTKRRFLAPLVLVVALALGGASTAGSSVAGAEVDPALTAALESATDVEAVVTFAHEGAPTAADVALLRHVGITQGFTFRALPIAGVVATAEQVEALATRPEVLSLYLNSELQYDLHESTALIGVDRLRADGKLTRKNGGSPVDGTGATVLVNDSGVDGTHHDHRYPDHLVQNVEAAANPRAWSSLLPVVYVEDVPNTDATGGHGTHVAGIVGATGARSAGKYEGVAPGADLIGYGSGAGLLLLDVLGGFDYAIANRDRYGIDVITNSWGSTGDRCTPVDPEDPVTYATYLTYKAGIAVVFSAGNSGPNPCTITGNYKKAPWVISVAAGDKQRNLAGFSSRGSAGGGGSFTIDGQTWTWEDRPTLTAPGVLIVSTRTASPIGVVGTDDDLTHVDPAYLPYYTTLSGTSMAAPHVAGTVALMLDANPALTPLQVKNILQQTATPLPSYATWQVGAGYLDAYAAVGQAFKTKTG
ncbi:MAG: S8 family serine peptidase [Thermoleophilia bacterium]|nr:S8 family serine peptidase [Thermoleophilia bacterium]